jgi:transposase
MAKRYYKQAPFNYDCHYKHCCPHLEGLSTQWVFQEYQCSHEEHLEHWRVRDDLQEQLKKALVYIKELEEKNDELKAKLEALHRRQFKANKKRNQKEAESKAEASDSKKKRGAPKGHPGWFRGKPDHINKTVVVPAPKKCPHCKCPQLKPVKEIKNHLQEDIIVQPRTHVTNFRHHQAFCPKCRRLVIEAAEGELPNCHIGPTTKAAAIYLRYGLNLPYRKVRELFDVFFNMPFVPASALAFDRRATQKGGALYQDLKEKVRAAAFVHADETHWREDGINQFVWYAGNNELAFYLIDQHRSSEVAQSILGDEFSGILNTDGYAAYNAVNAKERQSCLAHLIRKAREIKQEILLKKPRFQDKRAIRFCDRVITLFKEACDVGQKLLTEDISLDRAKILRKRFYATIRSICSTQLAHEKAETLRRRLRDPTKEYHRLFTFLKYPEIQPTNNHAERSLRPLVIFRKICFGTRSQEGSRSHSVLPSLLTTAKRQGQDPLFFFTTLLQSDTKTAQATLYNNSS